MILLGAVRFIDYKTEFLREGRGDSSSALFTTELRGTRPSDAPGFIEREDDKRGLLALSPLKRSLFSDDNRSICVEVNSSTLSFLEIRSV